jgi:hypothetical protein
MCADSKGRVPLWEAMRGRHDEAVQLLVDAGADLSSGDAALYTRVAVEEDDAALLEDVARRGGDVTVPCWDDGVTALHRAAAEGNVRVAKVLLEHGANADREDGGGRTPRSIADQLGHRDMQALFTGWSQQGNVQQGPPKPQQAAGLSTTDHQHRKVPAGPVTRFSSAPAVRLPYRDSIDSSPASSMHSSPRVMTTAFKNSLFGVLSSSHVHRHDGGGGGWERTRLRVTISCPEKSSSAKKLVFMPETVRQLVELGGSTFRFAPAARAVTTDGAAIEDARLVRDGDHILIVTDQWVPPETGIVNRIH